MVHVADSERLSSYIERVGGDPRQALKVIPQLVNVLDYVHRLGFVHRDVWSENVLVDAVGRAVLIDFGSAEPYETSSGLRSNLRLNLPYTSPEAKIDTPKPSEDCWALGLLITEVVTGKIVGFRLGRFDMPAHKIPRVVEQAVRETVAIGGPLLACLCQVLLESNPARRATMSDCATWCKYGPVLRSPYSSSMDLSDKQTAPTSGTRAPLRPGVAVMYTARSNGMRYPAVIMARTESGWKIRLQNQNGLTKDVSDEDSWRLALSAAGI